MRRSHVLHVLSTAGVWIVMGCAIAEQHPAAAETHEVLIDQQVELAKSMADHELVAQRFEAEAAARHERIAVQACYFAEKRGFMPGAELDDWLAAEAHVDAQPREPQTEAHAERGR